MPNCLDDYYQELLTERDEEILRLREEIAVLKSELSDLTGFNEQLERERSVTQKEVTATEALQNLFNTMEAPPPNSGCRGYVYIPEEALQLAQEALRPSTTP